METTIAIRSTLKAMLGDIRGQCLGLQPHQRLGCCVVGCGYRPRHSRHRYSLRYMPRSFFQQHCRVLRISRGAPSSAAVLSPVMVIEVDSMLIVLQMFGRWGCHRRHLRNLLAECYDLGKQLTQARCAWSIRHIYRELNQVADKLTGDCLISPANDRASPSW